MTTVSHEITDLNGTDILFQTESAFVASSLTVVQRIISTNIETLLDVEPMGDVYFKTSVAPPSNCVLQCIYESALETPVGTDGLTEWESGNIQKILGTLLYMSQSLDNMKEALNHKVSMEEYYRVNEKHGEDIKEIKNLLRTSYS